MGEKGKRMSRRKIYRYAKVSQEGQSQPNAISKGLAAKEISFSERRRNNKDVKSSSFDHGFLATSHDEKWVDGTTVLSDFDDRHALLEDMDSFLRENNLIRD